MREMTLQPLFVMTDGGRREGQLVLADGDLVAVFVRVSAEELAGDIHNRDGWFLEAGFGPCSRLYTVLPPVFDSLEEATAWAIRQLDAKRLPTGP
jgi:hypothetical protein